MGRPKRIRAAANFNSVRRTRPDERLCQRPNRRPGVAPDCEDAREDTPRPVSLPKLGFMERDKNG